MSRRSNSRRAAGRSGALPDPALLMGAVLAFRAEDAVVNAGLVDSIAPYVGAVSALPSGTKKAAPVSDALMGGAQTIPSAGEPGYTVAYTAPTAMTVIGAWRYTAGNHTFYAHTVGGSVNTGQAVFKQGTALNHRSSGGGLAIPNGDVAQVVADSALSVVTASVLSPGAQVAGRLNSVTPSLSSSNVISLAGGSLRLMDISSAAGYPLTGAFGCITVWDRVLSANEIGYAMAIYGRKYGITVAGAPPLA